ncbi:hypothetical protein COO60DRAFT_1704952, partial [Scenedesmus sp. NREL 46B-D3]
MNRVPQYLISRSRDLESYSPELFSCYKCQTCGQQSAFCESDPAGREAASGLLCHRCWAAALHPSHKDLQKAVDETVTGSCFCRRCNALIVHHLSIRVTVNSVQWQFPQRVNWLCEACGEIVREQQRHQQHQQHAPSGNQQHEQLGPVSPATTTRTVQQQQQQQQRQEVPAARCVYNTELHSSLANSGVFNAIDVIARQVRQRQASSARAPAPVLPSFVPIFEVSVRHKPSYVHWESSSMSS